LAVLLRSHFHQQPFLIASRLLLDLAVGKLIDIQLFAL
jgi:hypothetical protein